ncbi:MAG: deoxyribodipyrimidine photo-lyase, partial [Bacteroidia bacterium]
MTAFWFRRDLRLTDNMGLYKALCAGEKVIPIFIFDKSILDTLPKQDKRVNFIHQQIERLQQELIELGSSLCVYYGEVMEAWKYFCEQYPIQSVFTNHDYEPYAKQRD